jgi:hypothetical protein
VRIFGATTDKPIAFREILHSRLLLGLRGR